MPILPAKSRPVQVYRSDFNATEDEIRQADLFAFLADDPGNDPEGYHVGWREPRPPVEPFTTSEAWWAGFGLGDDGVVCPPIGWMPPAERRAFRDAYEIGYSQHVERLVDELAEAEAWAARIEAEGDGRPDWNESEYRHLTGR